MRSIFYITEFFDKRQIWILDFEYRGADYYEKEVDNEIKNISTIIEPVMMICMGLMAILIVAAILLPIYGLVNQTGFTGTG